MAELRPRVDEFVQAGARLVVIGNGWPAAAKAFAEAAGLPPAFTLYTDPSKKAFDAAGLVRSALATLSPVALALHIRARVKGFAQGKLRGDPWQQGGALVVAPGGKVLFRHVSLAPGHHAHPGKLLGVLRKNAAA